MDVSASTEPVTGATVVTLAGQLDIDTAKKLHATMDGLRADGVTRMVVDLADLTFCDSVGLSALVVAHRQCAAEGGYLRLAAPTRFLLRVLGGVGVSPAVPAYATVAAACAGDPDGLLPA